MDKHTNKKPEEQPEDLSKKMTQEPTEEQLLDASIAKLLFDAETGGTSYFDPNLPPEMREAFMNQIRAFEDQMEDAEPVTIRELIGLPDVPYLDEVAQDGPVAVRRETERLLERITTAGFTIERPEELEDNDSWYSFLTEMLLEHEVIPFVYPEGVAKALRYLDFDEVVASSRGIEMMLIEAFLFNLFILEEPFDEELLADYVQLGGESVPKKQALKYINNWRKQFTSIVPLSFGEIADAPPMPPVEDSDAAPFLFGVAYEATHQNGKTEVFEGPGVCLVLYGLDGPQIVGASFAGFEL